MSDQMPEPPGPPLVGQVIGGRYRLTKLLGQGGMGEVYSADHIHITKKVAVKLCGVGVCKAMRPQLFSAPKLSAKMKGPVVTIDIDLGYAGSASAVAHTCDFSYDYVKINAEYHT